MEKIAFKNPKGGTIYFAKVGFDWGAFWALFALMGLPFFLRKMNVLGAFCLMLYGIWTVALGFEHLSEGFSWATIVGYALISFAFSLYFGIKGGKLTARHYLEEGYKPITKDEKLLAKVRAKWDMEI